MLLAGLLASSVLFCSAQTSTTPSATKPAPKKATTTGTSKTAAAAKTTAPAALTTDKDKTSYAIGADLGMKLKQAEIDVDPAILSRAVKDVLSGGKTAMTDDEVRAKLMELTKGLQAKQQENQKKQAEADKSIGEKNRKDGDAFLAENKSKEGVVALPSGLQYKILKTGDGPKPTPQDTVTCNYRGTLLDGKEFDSSYKRGQPASFPVGGVIKGWTEGLQLMPVGSKWQLFIPADLAYGDRRAGPDITPGSTLIFEVELLSIKDKNAPAAQQATPPPSGTATPQ
jgi:FKBP-type peptidyl-prolyl cis-trans isomerase FklB